jgi:large subunit ribosomal protein L10
MPKEKKEEAVKRIEEFISGSKATIITDYRGMSVTEMSQLRHQLRNAKVEYHVVKNTLASLAAERVGKEELKEFLKGPTAIAFGYGEATEPSKIIVEYIRSSKASLSVKGGLLDKRVLSSAEVTTLASLPPTEILISQVMRQMQAPIFSLLTVLSANLRGFVGVLQARKQQLEGG